MTHVFFTIRGLHLLLKINTFLTKHSSNEDHEIKPTITPNSKMKCPQLFDIYMLVITATDLDIGPEETRKS